MKVEPGLLLKKQACIYQRHLKTFLQGLQEGKAFKRHFNELFGTNVNEMLKLYIDTLQRT
jgi:hypothetical protein